MWNLKQSISETEYNGDCQGLKGGKNEVVMFVGYKVSVMEDNKFWRSTTNHSAYS